MDSLGDEAPFFILHDLLSDVDVLAAAYLALELLRHLYFVLHLLGRSVFHDLGNLVHHNLEKLLHRSYGWLPVS